MQLAKEGPYDTWEIVDCIALPNNNYDQGILIFFLLISVTNHFYWIVILCNYTYILQRSMKPKTSSTFYLEMLKQYIQNVEYVNLKLHCSIFRMLIFFHK